MDSILFARYIMYELDRLKKKDNSYEYNNTKIQKLLYIFYGFYWTSKGLRLLQEQPKLWPFGPVFPKVFTFIQKEGFKSLTCGEANNLPFDKKDKENFKKILENYGSFKAGVLSEWSHQEGSPWYRTKKDMENVFGKEVYGEAWSGWNTPIKDEYIQDYFKEMSVLG